MNKICTSIEQSKKLIEFGLDVKTADMFWSLNPEVLVASEYMTEDNCIPCVDAIPAWSLSALLELMPYPFLSELSNGIWKCGSYPKGICNYVTSESSLDAAFEMVCWLLENKKI